MPIQMVIVGGSYGGTAVFSYRDHLGIIRRVGRQPSLHFGAPVRRGDVPAVALVRQRPDFHIEIMAGNAAAEHELHRLLPTCPPNMCMSRLIIDSRWLRAAHLASVAAPLERIAVLRSNLERFRFQLLPGAKSRDRLQEKGYLRPGGLRHCRLPKIRRTARGVTANALISASIQAALP